MGSSDITRILASGEPDAVEKVMPFVYDELRNLAASHLRHERVDHTLQPTALVHELYVKLAAYDGFDATNRGHFFATAASCIRQILVDHARRSSAQKRGSDWQRVTLNAPITPGGGNEIDIMILHDAMEQLSAIDARRASIVELRVFGGMTGNEIADHMGLSRTSVAKEWRFAQAWLSRALAE